MPDIVEREVGKGLASWYGKGFHGRPTASGERFDMHALTAAHPTLPFGTLVRVRSVEDGRTVDVRINDRGPWIKRRVIDLSRAAAEALGLIDLGTGTRRVVLSVFRHRREERQFAIIALRPPRPIPRRTSSPWCRAPRSCHK